MPTSTQNLEQSERSQKSPAELRQLLVAVLSGLKNASKKPEGEEQSHLPNQPKEPSNSERLQPKGIGPESRMKMSSSTQSR
jgi:hypothetical protein